MGGLSTQKQPDKTAIILPWEKLRGGEDGRNAEARLEEAKGLAFSIGLEVVYAQIIPLRSKRPATLLGSGQIHGLLADIEAEDVSLVIIDGRLTPVQQRNLEKEFGTKVIDRTALILDIFGERAATREGSLQVELAHLEYQRSRLVRSWTHLERQRGGFGFLGGPGETQIEADRRMIGDRITKIRKELEQVRRTRGLHRESRKKVPFPIVALVGYTNAGKSTLFNALTGAAVHAQDQLFATLDPTMRAIDLPSGRKIILSDTVGFISDLPTELIAAFRATLEEIAEADIILHVRDISNPETTSQQQDVLSVLAGMEKDGTLDAKWQSRMIDVLNKVDLLDIPVPSSGLIDADPVYVSAITGYGLDVLAQRIEHFLGQSMEEKDYHLFSADGEKLAWLYQHGEVIKREDNEQDIFVKVRLMAHERARFEQKFNVTSHH